MLILNTPWLFQSHSAEMSDKEWNYVMVMNSLLHGMFVDANPHSLQKARRPGTSPLMTQAARPAPERWLTRC
jgi:hypothetical protein